MAGPNERAGPNEVEEGLSFGPAMHVCFGECVQSTRLLIEAALPDSSPVLTPASLALRYSRFSLIGLTSDRSRRRRRRERF